MIDNTLSWSMDKQISWDNWGGWLSEAPLYYVLTKMKEK